MCFSLAHSLLSEVSGASQEVFLPYLVGVLAGVRLRNLSTCPLYLPLIAQEAVSSFCLGTANWASCLQQAPCLDMDMDIDIDIVIGIEIDRYGATFGQNVLFFPSCDWHFFFFFNSRELNILASSGIQQLALS